RGRGRDAQAGGRALTERGWIIPLIQLLRWCWATIARTRSNLSIDLGQLRLTDLPYCFLHRTLVELAMPRPPLRQILLSFLVVLLTPFAFPAKTPHAKKSTPKPPPAPAAAPANFDGRWSVVIITDSGSCDRAYRYRVRISGGRLYYDGDSAAVINGQV